MAWRNTLGLLLTLGLSLASSNLQARIGASRDQYWYDMSHAAAPAMSQWLHPSMLKELPREPSIRTGASLRNTPQGLDEMSMGLAGAYCYQYRVQQALQATLKLPSHFSVTLSKWQDCKEVELGSSVAVAVWYLWSLQSPDVSLPSVAPLNPIALNTTNGYPTVTTVAQYAKWSGQPAASLQTVPPYPVKIGVRPADHISPEYLTDTPSELVVWTNVKDADTRIIESGLEQDYHVSQILSRLLAVGPESVEYARKISFNTPLAFVPRVPVTEGADASVSVTKSIMDNWLRLFPFVTEGFHYLGYAVAILVLLLTIFTYKGNTASTPKPPIASGGARNSATRLRDNRRPRR